MNTPKVSIITVCRNAAHTIADTLQSVAQQRYPHIEHIVIDGASTDGTQAVIAQHGKHVAHVVSEADRGIYDAMNKGLALATGEVICFLNADDLYAHDDILSLVARRMATERLDALMGDVVFIDNKTAKVVRYYQSSYFHPKRLVWGYMPAHPALFVKQQVFQTIGGFKADYKIAGDFEWLVRAFAGNKPAIQHYAYQKTPLVTMRSGGVSSGLQSRWIINQEILRACREHNLNSNLFKISLRYFIKLGGFFITRKAYISHLARKTFPID